MYLRIITNMILLFLFIFTIGAGNVYSQYENYDKVEVGRSHYICARTMTDNIAGRLRLNENQKKKIIDILVDYQDNLFDLSSDSYENSELVGGRTKSKSSIVRDMDKSANHQIMNILDIRQLTIYNKIKPDWWKHFKEILSKRK